LNKRLFIILLFAFLGPWSHAQLVTTSGIGPAQLVQNILVGQGVTVSNVQFTGANTAIGSFQAVNTSLGMDEGIIMTTGTVNSGPAGPHGPNNRPDAGLDNGAAGYAPLTNIVGTNTFNAAVLEFDFVPQSDTVRFEYIFGSDEYPEYVNSQFNDVFAFFISGPGIPGGQQNMAIIPGTTQPVAINNVNNGTNNTGPCTNCNFYVNNGTGNNAPFNQNIFYIQYDGFTTPLEAVSPVECGETYHLIISISDVGDAIWDSGIFLAANSLSSEQPVNVSYELTSDPFNDGQTMAQGCSGATITITRGGSNINDELVVPITLSGSAIPGIDYTNLPNEVTFAPGQTEIIINLEAFAGGAFVGTANIVISFEIFDPCGNNNFQVIELFINETEDVEVTLTSDEIACPGESVTIFATPSGGGNGYNYLWNTGETTQSISVTPQTTETYSVEVTDNCLDQTAFAEITVDVPTFDPLVLDVTPDITEQCPFVPFDLTVDATGGAGSYTFTWTDANGNVLSNSDLMTVIPSSTTTYYVTVEDVCGDFAEDSVTITILSPPLEVIISPFQEICPGDSVEILTTASGGFGDYYFFWPHSGETTPSVWVSPNETTDYRVIVRDDCQTFQIRADTRVIVVRPEAQFQVITDPIFMDFPITFQNLSFGAIGYDWDFGDGNTSTQTHPNNTFPAPGQYEITLTATDENGCSDTISKIINVLLENFIYVPNAFTPETGDINNFFSASTVNIAKLNVLVFNRWGQVIYESDEVNFQWNGRYKGRPVRPGVYPWIITYTPVNGDEEIQLEGFVTVLR